MTADDTAAALDRLTAEIDSGLDGLTDALDRLTVDLVAALDRLTAALDALEEDRRGADADPDTYDPHAAR